MHALSKTMPPHGRVCRSWCTLVALCCGLVVHSGVLINIPGVKLGGCIGLYSRNCEIFIVKEMLSQALIQAPEHEGYNICK